MSINRVQSSNYSQPAFGTKMDKRLLKHFKKEFVSEIKDAKEPEKLSELRDLAKRFETYLGDIKSEKNPTTILSVKNNDRSYTMKLVGCGYEKELLHQKSVFGYFLSDLERLMDNHPAHKIKQTEKEFYEKFVNCEEMKNEIFNTSFFSEAEPKRCNFFRRLFRRKD